MILTVNSTYKCRHYLFELKERFNEYMTPGSRELMNAEAELKNASLGLVFFFCVFFFVWSSLSASSFAFSVGALLYCFSFVLTFLFAVVDCCSSISSVVAFLSFLLFHL